MGLGIAYVLIGVLLPYLAIYGGFTSFSYALRSSIRQAILVALIWLNLYLLFEEIMVEAFVFIPYLALFVLLLGGGYYIQRQTGQIGIRYLVWVLTAVNILLLLYPFLEQGIFLIVYFGFYGLLIFVVNGFQKYFGNTISTFEIGTLAFSTSFLLRSEGIGNISLLFFIALSVLLLAIIFLRWRRTAFTLTRHEIFTIVISNLVLVISTLIGTSIFLMAMFAHSNQFYPSMVAVPPLPDGTFPISAPSAAEVASEFNTTRIVPAIFMWLLPIGFTAYAIKSRTDTESWYAFLVLFGCHTLILIAIGTISFLLGVEDGSSYLNSWFSGFLLSVAIYPIHTFSVAFSTLLVERRKQSIARKRKAMA